MEQEYFLSCLRDGEVDVIVFTLPELIKYTRENFPTSILLTWAIAPRAWNISGLSLLFQCWDGQDWWEHSEVLILT